MPNFEAHILVSPNEEAKLNEKFSELKKAINSKVHVVNVRPMATITTTGINPRQPMITYIVTNETDESVKNITDTIKSIMVQPPFELNVVRFKIEQLLSGDHPELKVTGDEYFESHVKIGKTLPNDDEYRKMATICLKYGVQLVVNPYSKVIAPVTTFRKYDATYTEFINLHESLVNDLTNCGYELFKIHLEMGILDTNVHTDEGWLFKNGCYKTPITEPDELRLTCPKL